MNWVCDWASVDCSVEFGRAIGITHRNIAKNDGSPANIIAFSSTKVVLKPKGKLFVQVVLLISTHYITRYSVMKMSWNAVMEASHRVVQYFWTQKVWKLKGNHNLEFIYTTLKFTIINVKLKNVNRKCCLVTDERWLLSYELFIATKARKVDVISSKDL